MLVGVDRCARLDALPDLCAQRFGIRSVNGPSHGAPAALSHAEDGRLVAGMMIDAVQPALQNRPNALNPGRPRGPLTSMSKFIGAMSKGAWRRCSDTGSMYTMVTMVLW
jgi:hypothetical protein